MTVASGIPSYEEVSSVIEVIVNTEGRRYPIPGMDFEDTAQEIRLECFRVLHHYDASRIGPSPYKFLQTCIKNFLYNQRRGIWVPNNPPCVRCPLWDKVKKNCIVNEVDCSKIVQYRENMAIKAELKQPASLEVDLTDSIQEVEVDHMILDQSIKQKLPKNLIDYYELLKQGEDIPQKIKKQIREIIMEIINDA